MLSPRFLSDPSPRTILALLEDADGLHSSEEDDGLRTSIILRHGIRWAVEHADIGLIAWFVGLQGIWVGLNLMLLGGLD